MMVKSPAGGHTGTQFDDWEEPGVCIVCNHRRLRPLPRLGHLVRCSACGHIQLSPRPTQAAISASYDLPEGGTHSTWAAQRQGRNQLWGRRADRVSLSFNEPGTTLDIGAGFGDFLAELKLRGWEVAGTEVSQDAIEQAAASGIELRLGTPEEAGFAANSFDLITMWHVLEHLPWPGRTLKECARLLRPSGLLIVAVPNDSLFPRLAAFAALGRAQAVTALWGRRGPGEEIHLSFFSPQRVRRALAMSGLTPIELDLDDHYPESSPASERALRMHRAVWLASGRRFSLHRTIYAAARAPS